MNQATIEPSLLESEPPSTESLFERDEPLIKMRSTNKATKKIAVLLGDPSKTDNVKPDGVFDEDDFATINQMKTALEALDGYSFQYVYNHDSLFSDLATLKNETDLILNLCDEGYQNDPLKELHMPALLEMFNIPYTGGNPQCLAHCYDKSLVRGVAKEIGVPVSQAIFIDHHSDVNEIANHADYPVLLKPNFGDSSMGITQKNLVRETKEFLEAIERIKETCGQQKPILAEEFLPGKEITVGIIGNAPDYIVLPIIEEDYSALPEDLPKICGYEAKWDMTSPYQNLRSIPANLPEHTEKSIIDWCIKMYERLGCRDYARFDWRFDAQGNPKLLEANPNPGWCWDGHMAKMSAHAGISYSQMLGLILEAAEKRVNR